MKSLPSPAGTALVALALLLAGTAFAGDGHDHGDAPAAAGGSALPRFAAVSETFELVGVLSGKQLTLYLDRTADNSPVAGAQIELEVAGVKFKAEPHGEAEYEVVLATVPPPGVLPITATVTAGAEADLLAGELDLHESAPAAPAGQASSWKRFAAWGAGGLAALALLAVVARRRVAPRRAGMGAAA